MPSTHKHIRSSTANKRPTTAIADGQIAMNTNSTSPGLFFKDSTGATIIKIGPVHVGATAPNVSPASGGSSGNSTGEVWLDTSLTPNGVKIWNGSSWTNATPIGSTTVQGLLELATNAETQTGTDIDRAVTPAGLQSKVSDSVSTTSSTTIASSTAVKAAYDLAVAAVPLSGGTVTGNLEIGTTGSLSFEGATADGNETTLSVENPTADRTIRLPNQSGDVLVSGNASIVNADVSASAEIAVSKLADGAARQLLQTDAAGTGVEWTSNVDVPGTLDVTSTATFDNIASHPLGSAGAPTITFTGDTNTGIYSPGADQVAISTNGTGRIFVESNGRLGVNVSNPAHLLQVSGNTCVAGTADNVFFGVDDNTSPRLGIVKKSGTGPVFAAGSATSFIFSHSSGTDIASPATQTYSERARIDSSGRLLVGTSSTSNIRFQQNASFVVTGNSTYGGATFAGYSGTGLGDAAPNLDICRSRGTTDGSFTKVENGDRLGALVFRGADGSTWRDAASIASSVDGGTGASDMPGRLVFSTTADGASSPTERMRISSAGNVGIGTTSPYSPLTVRGLGNNITLDLNSTTTNDYSAIVWNGSTVDVTANSTCEIRGYRVASAAGELGFHTRTAGGISQERARIDSSGRLLVGTSTSTNNARLDQKIAVVSTTANYPGISVTGYVGSTLADYCPLIDLQRSRGTTDGSLTVVANGDALGRIAFRGADGTNFRDAATINAFVDGTPGANDMPGRLVFSTTADGASSPTERMRISSSGNVLVGRTYTGNEKIGIGGGTATYSTGTSATGFADDTTVSSAQTNLYTSYSSYISTQAAAFTLGNLTHFKAAQFAIGAGSSVTSQYGFFADAALTGATNNFGFYSNIASGAGRFNFYANGTAINYFAGNVGIGTTSPGGTLDIKAATSTAPLVVQGPSSEFSRIDSSGRLLVGTSTALNVSGSAGFEGFQVAGTGSGSNVSLSRWAATTGAAVFSFAKSRGASIGTNAVVVDGDSIGRVEFNAADGTSFISAAQIQAFVDGTPGTNDMPGRIVLSVTADGASSPTEALRITNDRVIARNQGAPAAVNATATLTVANLKTGIITSTSAAATDMTLPTGTLTEGGFAANSLYDNFTFEWSVINTGPSLVRVLAGTAHTIVGSGSVATGTSGRFASRRTAANTFVTYRLS
jgi:hypothetical protein